MTKTAEKPYLYSPYKGVPPPGEMLQDAAKRRRWTKRDLVVEVPETTVRAC